MRLGLRWRFLAFMLGITGSVVCLTAGAQQPADADVSPALPEVAERQPALVTFGRRASQSEGDHDFRQIVRIQVPQSADPVFVRLFDPDIGGLWDEPSRGFNSRTRFSIFGGDADVSLFRDEDGVVQEEISGEPLDSRSFNYVRSADGQWVDVFTVQPAQGKPVGDKREFYLLVEGIAGNDGNVFDVYASRFEGYNSAIPGSRMYAYLPTLQVPLDPELMAEFRFRVPDDAQALSVENFDAAGASVFFEGRFRYRPLDSSDASEWVKDRLLMYRRESSLDAAITARAGEESPNDMTFFVQVDAYRDSTRPLRTDANGDRQRSLEDDAIEIELPPRFFRPHERPKLAFDVTHLACNDVRLDAGRSIDPAGERLAFRIRPDRNADWKMGAVLEHSYPGPGRYRARIEAFNNSNRVGNGTAQNIQVTVKGPPTAAFVAPALVPENPNGTSVQFDASASTANAFAASSRINRMVWDFGDGQQLEQIRGDDNFARPTHVYQSPGVYSIKLEVIDDEGHPCNSDHVTKILAINGMPMAEAGEDRQMIAGEPALFDGRASTDAEGALSRFDWDFGNGETASGPTIRHSFHEAGDYTVALTVTDSNANFPLTSTDHFKVTVIAPSNDRPISRVSMPRTGLVGQSILFDGSKSIDDDGRVLFFNWDFGDGQQSRDPVVEHTFWEPGIYEVSLRVEDDDGADQGWSVWQDTIEISYEEPIAPTFAFPGPFEGLVNEAITFKAISAQDPDGSVVSYDWEFGDGARGRGQTVRHQFQNAGEYEGTLTLTDNTLPNAQVTSVSFITNVALPENVAPVATLTVPTELEVRQIAEFGAAMSGDKDGHINAYDWTMGDTRLSNGIKTLHAYQFPGTYTVEVTTTDDGPFTEKSATTMAEVTVVDRENAVPQAVLQGKLEVEVDEILQFDASASFDPDGNILTFAWDFGDGGASAQKRPRHTFHDPGTYTVSLTVTDDDQPAAHHTAEITVVVRPKS